MKTCNRCHVEKPLTEFSATPNSYHRAAAGKPHRTCKRCRDRRSTVERERRQTSADRRLGEREAWAESRREQAVLARRAEDDEARTAESWAMLRAHREEASG